MKPTLLNKLHKHTLPATGEWSVERKHDGCRMLVHADMSKKEVQCFSRGGYINKNFPHVENQIIERLSEKGETGEWWFDGEVIAHSFKFCSRQFNKPEGARTADFRYCIFDVPSLQQGSAQLQARYDWLKSNWYSEDEGKTTFYVSRLGVVDGLNDLDQYMETAESEGWEGLVIKKLSSEYAQDERTYNWLKWKPSYGRGR